MNAELHDIHAIGHKAPHIMHTATVNDAITPTGLHTTIALTKCGKAIHNFMIVDDTSLLCTDGSVYMTPCKMCEATK